MTNQINIKFTPAQIKSLYTTYCFLNIGEYTQETLKPLEKLLDVAAISESEVPIIQTSQITGEVNCIVNGRVHHYNAIEKTAVSGDIVYITDTDENCVFGSEYIGRAFIVNKRAADITNSLEKEFSPGVYIKVFDYETNTYRNWKLNDNQYCVLCP